MDLMVREIEYNKFKNFLDIFDISQDIEFVKELVDEPYDDDYKVQPYKIREFIIDLELLLNECNDVSFNRSSKRKLVEWNDFSLFWRVMQNIKHKRIIGKQLPDIEYVYEFIKSYTNLKVIKSAKLEGFSNPNIDVIYGKSNEIELYLMQEPGIWEFILSINYKGKNVTHWHPQSCEDTINDMKAILDDLYIVHKKKRNLSDKVRLVIPTLREKDSKQLKKYTNNELYEIVKF